MKPKNLIILIVAMFAFAIGAAAQETTEQPPAAPKAEAMTENDRIPFMQTENADDPADAGSGSMIFKTFGAMFIIIGLLFFGAWGVKKYGLFGVTIDTSSDRNELDISTTKTVANGQTISVVRFRDRVLLIGSTAQSFTLLADEPAAGTLPSSPKSVSDLLAEENANFQTKLSNAQDRFESWNDIGGKLS